MRTRPATAPPAGSSTSDRPDTRLVAIADAYEPFAVDAAKRFGYERSETIWQAIVDAPDIDVVSVAVANSMHREVVEALLAAGKHVLCEKPLAPSVEDAKAMVAAAEAATTHAGVGFTFRRAPGINAIREQVEDGLDRRRCATSTATTGATTPQNPDNPISWRYRGGPGSGALADIGSHMIDLGEYVCGPITSVSGAVFQTFTTERPVPAGVTVGHARRRGQRREGGGRQRGHRHLHGDLRQRRRGHLLDLAGRPRPAERARLRGLRRAGPAAYDLNRPGEFTFADQGPAGVVNGPRQVLLGPDHPYLERGLPMDFPSVGHGQNDFFAWQARAFLDQVAGLDRLPAVPTLRHGLHNMEILAAVTQSALNGGQAVSLA